MASIVVAGDTSGTVTLTAPAVSGTTTLTLPTTTGTVLASNSATTLNSGASAMTLQTNGTTALTIDTSQRAAFVAGTAAAPAITTTGNTNTGMFFPAADTIAFAEGGTEAMRLNSSGNVGIGTNNPRNLLTVNGIVSGLSITTGSGSSNTGIGGTGCYMVFLSWNNGNGYATVIVNSANLNNSGVILASSNASGGNNAFDCVNNFASNSGNGIAFFSNAGLNLQTKNNWTGNAYPVYINIFGM